MPLWHITEIGISTLLLICLVDAYRKDKILLLLFLLFDAYAFELTISSLFQPVYYSHAFFSLGIPVIIPVGWAALIYSSLAVIETNNSLLKAILVALSLTAIDLVLDKVAVAADMWKWTETEGYFGIPYKNFFAWFLYSFLITFFVTNILGKITFKRLVYAFLGITAAGLLLGMIWNLIPLNYQKVAFFSIIVFSFIYIILKIHGIHFKHENSHLFIIPLSFYFFSFFLIFLKKNILPIEYVILSISIFILWAAFYFITMLNNKHFAEKIT